MYLPFAIYSTISSLKAEFIPYLVKKQFSKDTKSDNDGDGQKDDTNKDLLSYIHEDDMTKQINDMSTWIDHHGDMEDCYHDNKVRCYAYIQKEGLCVRENTISAYAESSKQVRS